MGLRDEQAAECCELWLGGMTQIAIGRMLYGHPDGGDVSVAICNFVDKYAPSRDRYRGLDPAERKGLIPEALANYRQSAHPRPVLEGDWMDVNLPTGLVMQQRGHERGLLVLRLLAAGVRTADIARRFNMTSSCVYSIRKKAERRVAERGAEWSPLGMWMRRMEHVVDLLQHPVMVEERTRAHHLKALTSEMAEHEAMLGL